MKFLFFLLASLILWPAAQAQSVKAKLVLRGEANVIPSRIVSSYDGGYLISGSANLYSGPTQRDLLIAKFDHDLNLIWRRVLGTAKDENAMALMETSAHDIVIAYTTCDSLPVPGGNFSAMHLLKLDASGNTRWVKSYFHNRYCLGAPVRSIFERQDGNYVVFNDPSVLTFGEPVGVLVTDTAGNVVSDKQIRNPSSIDFPRVAKYGNNFLIAGTDDIIAISKNSLMYAFCDASGTVRHSGRYINSDDLNLNNVSAMPDGNVLLLGSTSAAPFIHYLMKIDTSGNRIWTKSYSANNDTFFMSLVTGGNRMFLLGGCYLGGHANADIHTLAAEIDTAGNFLWAKAAPVPSGPLDAVYDAADHTAVLTSYYYLPPYTTLLMRMEMSPTLSCGEQAISIHSGTYGMIANLTGTVNDTVSTHAVSIPTRSTGGSGPVADSLLCGIPAAVSQASGPLPFRIYPNPLRPGSQLIIEADITGHTKLEIYDVSGRMIYSRKLFTAVSTVDDLPLRSGIYFIRLVRDGRTSVQKLVMPE